MRSFTTAFLCLLVAVATSLRAQTLSFFDVDASSFPTMKGKFYAFDPAGQQVGLSQADLSLTEDGIPRTILSVTCPPPPSPRALSSVLVVDVSGSMEWGLAGTPNIDLARAAARAWVSALPFSTSECAITSFDHLNYLNQDFTTDATKLQRAIGALVPQGATNYDMGLLMPVAGGLEISKAGKHQKVIVFLTDGLPNQEPNVAGIIAEAQRQNCIVYAVTLGMPCPQSLKDITGSTGGNWYENVTTVGQAEAIYRQILWQAQSGSPCEITWESNGCPAGDRNAELRWNAATSTQTYTVPDAAAVELEFAPATMLIRSKRPGIPFDTTITVTAQNAAFNVANVTSSNPAYSIAPTSFTLAAGASRTLMVRYTPPDSGYTWTQFDIQSDVCTQTFYASGGFPGKAPSTPILKLTHPNGGEVLVAGSDTVITWSGLPPTDWVRLEYSTNSGLVWEPVASRVQLGRYEWHVPNTPSNTCLARVKRLNDYGADETGLIHAFSEIGGVSGIAWSPDGRRFATGGGSRIVKIWDAESGALLTSLTGHTNAIGALSWSPDGARIASASADGSARIWDAATGAQLQLLGGNLGILIDVQWNADGNRIATAGFSDGSIRIWDPATGALLHTLPHDASVLTVRWSPDGQYVVGTGGFATLKVWNAATGALAYSLVGHTQLVADVEWSLDGTRLATAGYDYAARIWDAADGSLIHTLTHGIGALAVAWSPDSRTLATAGFEGIVRTWNAADGSLIRAMDPKHDDLVGDLAWSPDGQYISSGSEDGTARLWNAASGALERTFLHGNIVGVSLWSPESRRVATLAADGVARMWAVEEAPLMEDVSDAVFAIVAPSPAIIEVDMGKVVVGSAKDSVVRAFVQNNGNYPFRVDSIQITGANATQFELVSGRPPFMVPANGFYSVEFRFTPASPGAKFGQLRVFTQTETLVQPIRGEGIRQTLKLAGGVIDFGQVPLGGRKDTLQAVTIANTGSAPVTITGTRHAGPNDVDFTTLAGGGSFTVQPGDTVRMDLRFTPSEIGRTSGQLLFDYGGDDPPVAVQLYGEGVAPTITVIEDTIDFGQVAIGDRKDTLRAVTVANLGTAPISITGTRHAGPNDVDFTTLTGGGSFILLPGDTARLDLRFIPSTLGTTQGRLLFDHDAAGSPATVYLIGEGVDRIAAAKLRAGSAEARAGEPVDIPIRLSDGLNIESSGATHFTARLRFNATLLEPIGSTPAGTIAGEDRILELQLPTTADTNGVLVTLSFRAALGTDSVTALLLEDPLSVGGPVTMSVEAGEFRLLDLCQAGGTRLLNPQGVVALKTVRPNPAPGATAEVELETIEEGPTQLLLRDAHGRTVRHLIDGELAPGRRTVQIPVGDLASGVYFLTLHTPTMQQTIRLEVTR